MTYPIRQPYQQDIIALTRCLYAVPPMHRDDVADEILDDAIRGYAHWRKTGRPHPTYGDGSLCDAALKRNPPGERPLTDQEWIACQRLALAKVGEVNDLARRRAA